jgi:NADH dehydrogenase
MIANKENVPHRIVILGGGAGGLELATLLGDRLGRSGAAAIMLVDRTPTHMWKPLLHEVAAGSMDVHAHQLDYLAQARWHHFQFRLGNVEQIDRQRREVTVGPVAGEDGEEMLPRRALAYDTLVIAVGSETNHFNTPGAAEHALMLDSAHDAERFHRKLIALCLHADAQAQHGEKKEVRVVIIGAGATGVELAAELRHTTRLLAAYGLEKLDPETFVRLTLIEAAPRILPPLSERISNATHELLEQIDVEVVVGERVMEITGNSVRTASGRVFPADLIVWAAGIKAPDWLQTLGLEVNRINQLVVHETLQTTRDPDVFAFGDCAACPWPGHKNNVPPRAQAAHQQATMLVKSMKLRLAGKPLPRYRYRDFGSLVSIGEGTAVGNLMGGLIGGSIFLEGLFAKVMYISLYRMHLAALHGWPRTLLDTFTRFLRSRTEPRVKLH